MFYFFFLCKKRWKSIQKIKIRRELQKCWISFCFKKTKWKLFFIFLKTMKQNLENKNNSEKRRRSWFHECIVKLFSLFIFFEKLWWSMLSKMEKKSKNRKIVSKNDLIEMFLKNFLFVFEEGNWFEDTRIFYFFFLDDMLKKCFSISILMLRQKTFMISFFSFVRRICFDVLKRRR